MFSKSCVGLELSRNLRMALMSGRAGKYRLQKNFEIPDFASMADEQRRETVSALIKKHAIQAGHVYLMLPSDQGIVRQMDLPVEVKSKLRSVIELQIESFSPWPASEVYWECTAAEPPKGAKSVVVSVAIAPKTAVDPWIEFFKSVGLPLSGCLLASLALSQGLSSFIQDRPAIVLNCDQDAVDGVLVSGGRFAHRTVRGDSPDSMVQSVVQTLSSTMRVPADKLALVCEGAGAGSVFPDLAPVAFPPPRDFEAVSIPGFGAMAAALAGFYSRTSGNVLPARLQYRTSRLRFIPTYVLSTLLFLVCGALLLRDTYQTYVYSKEVDAAITAVTPAVRELARQETELNGLLEKERVLFSDIGKPDAMADVMAELTRVMPRDSWLAGYSLQNNALTLTGYADRATDVQKLLEDSSLFRDVQFSSPITKEDAKDRFVIRAVLEEVQ